MYLKLHFGLEFQFAITLKAVRFALYKLVKSIFFKSF